MTINIMNKVLWNVMPCSLVDGQQRFSVPCGVSVPSQHSHQTIHLHNPHHQNLKSSVFSCANYKGAGYWYALNAHTYEM